MENEFSHDTSSEVKNKVSFNFVAFFIVGARGRCVYEIVGASYHESLEMCIHIPKQLQDQETMTDVSIVMVQMF